MDDEFLIEGEVFVPDGNKKYSIGKAAQIEFLIFALRIEISKQSTRLVK
jgi:hypothetical protein